MPQHVAAKDSKRSSLSWAGFTSEPGIDWSSPPLITLSISAPTLAVTTLQQRSVHFHALPRVMLAAVARPCRRCATSLRVALQGERAATTIAASWRGVRLRAKFGRLLAVETAARAAAMAAAVLPDAPSVTSLPPGPPSSSSASTSGLYHSNPNPNPYPKTLTPTLTLTTDH